jgi:hypothetical protein
MLHLLSLRFVQSRNFWSVEAAKVAEIRCRRQFTEYICEYALVLCDVLIFYSVLDGAYILYP